MDNMEITERSSKAELISSACELVDSQARQVETLQQQQMALLTLLGLAVALLLL